MPGAVVGVLLDHWAETTFRAPLLVAFNMAFLGLVLLLADRKASSTGGAEVSTRDALLIGLAQAAAIVPGVSRSGSTISAALFLGYERRDAARFSFLLATPITLGAVLVKIPKLLAAGGGGAALGWGMATAAVSGFLAIAFLLRLVRTSSYRPFAYYRWAFALVVVAVALARTARVV